MLSISRTLPWAPSQAAGDGRAGLSEDEKLQLWPDGPGPRGTAKGTAKEPVGLKGTSEGKAEGLEPRGSERSRGEERLGQGTIT